MKKTILALCLTSLSACATVGGHLPKTPGESSSGFGYVPLDPLAVGEVADKITCTEGTVPTPLLEALPDLATRFAVASIDTSGGVTFGASSVTAKGSSYKAILDYINADEIPVNFMIAKRVDHGNKSTLGSRFQSVTVAYPLAKGESIVKYSAILTGNNGEVFPSGPESGFDKEDYSPVTIPVYIGIGLRLLSSILAIKGGVNLTGLSAIGAQAELNNVSGSLTVQTLGVNGKPVASALPLPNKLDQTTVENGVLAIGGIRAILYSEDGSVTKTPRIVGLYSPIGNDPSLINAVYSELSKNRPPWPHRCKAKPN